MQTKDDGGPAFPRMTDNGSVEYPGMSLRDYFAAKVMAALTAADVDEAKTAEHLAMGAYELADAMLRERAK